MHPSTEEAAHFLRKLLEGNEFIAVNGKQNCMGGGSSDIIKGLISKEQSVLNAGDET